MSLIDSRKILIVENNSADRKTFRDYLAQEPDFQYAFWEEGTGAKGLQWLQSVEPDCILLDYMLPDMNGLDFLNELTRTGITIPPVVMLNDQTSAHVAVQALKTGATDYLVKSELNGETLRWAIRSAIENGELKQQLAEQQRELEAQRQQLEKSETSLRIALQAGRVGTWEWEMETNRVSWSANADEIMGVAPEDFGGTYDAFLELVHPEDRTGLKEAVAKAVAGEDDYQFVFRTIWPDGSLHWIEAKGQLITDQAGRPKSLIGTNSDITAQKQAEEKIQRQGQEFRTLTENLPDIIARFNRKLQHVFINSAVERATGLAPENFIGKSNQELGMPEEQCNFWDQKMLQVFETGQEVAFEFSFPGPDRTNYYESRVVPEFAADGSVEFILSVTRDITSFKLNEEEYSHLLEREQLSRQHAERAAQKTARLQAVTAALSQSLTIFEVTSVIVRQGIEALDAFAGSAALLHSSGEYLEVVNATGYSSELVEPWLTIPMQAPVPLTEALRNRSLIVVDTPEERRRRFPHLPDSQEGLPGSLAVIPLEIEERSLGVIGLSFSTSRQFSQEDCDFMLTLGRLCAQALERARLFEAEQQARKVAQQAQNELAFLAEAGVALTSDLDDRSVVNSLAQLLIPNLTDWGVLTLQEEDQPPFVCGIAHSHSDKAGLLEQLLQIYPDPPGIALEVMQTQEPFLISEITDEVLNKSFEDTRQREIVRELGAESGIILPLVVRGKSIGALGLNSATPGFYTNSQMPLLLEIARRVARAIDNAWLYHRAQTLAKAQIELNELKDLFMSIASHELRTPLTTAKGYTQVLQRSMIRQSQSQSEERKSDSTRNLNLLNNVLYQLDRLNGLIGTLLDFSRIQNGKLELNYKEKANLTELVQRVVEQQQQATTDHTLKVETAPDPIIGSYDEARLEQVLTNLINNAVKYSPGGTSVTVGIQLETNHQEVVLWVRDEGYGISPEAQARIFERFYRVRTEENSRVEGLGLGLYISHEIIIQHGGRMWLESKPGAGSTFYFSLPLPSKE